MDVNAVRCPRQKERDIVEISQRGPSVVGPWFCLVIFYSTGHIFDILLFNTECFLRLLRVFITV